MWTLVVEHPYIVSSALTLLLVMLLYVWMQIGEKSYLYAAGVNLILIIAVIALGHTIETDREQLERLVYETAELIETNQVDAAVAIIADPKVRQRASDTLANVEFHSARASNVRVAPVQGSAPPQAKVDLTASVRLSLGAVVKNKAALRQVTLTFEKSSNGDWFVTEYSQRPLGGGTDNFSPNRVIGAE